MRRKNPYPKEITDTHIQYSVPEYVYHTAEIDSISDSKFSFKGKKEGKLIPHRLKKIFEDKITKNLQATKMIKWRLNSIPVMKLNRQQYKILKKSKDRIAKEYMKAIEENNKIIPNVYCSYEWLRKNPQIFPVEDIFGYRGFIDNTSKKFFIPPYKKIDDEYFFRKEDAVYTFPNSIDKNVGLRRDVMYVYSRERTLATLNRNERLKEDKNKTLYSCFPLPYTEENKAYWNEKLLDYFWRMTVKKHFIIALSLHPNYFKRALLQDIGLKRFVCVENDVVLGVILWSDNGVFINIHYGIAHSSQHNKESRKNELKNPFIIMRWRFMERFPSGTLFNDGGCLFSNFTRKNKEMCNPINIYELRTHYNIDSYQYMENEELKKLNSVGRIKSEFKKIL